MIIVQSLVSLTLLLILMAYFWNPHREDMLRQDLFLLRDGLFDEAASGRISFDSTSYKYTRTVLNGFLRFGHRISLSRFAIAAMILTKEQKEMARASRAAVLSASSEADRLVCEPYLAEANRAIVRHLGKSPFMFVVLIPFFGAALALLGFSLANEVVNRCRTLFARLDEVAYQEGKAGKRKLNYSTDSLSRTF